MIATRFGWWRGWSLRRQLAFGVSAVVMVVLLKNRVYNPAGLAGTLSLVGIPISQPWTLAAATSFLVPAVFQM